MPPVATTTHNNQGAIYNASLWDAWPSESEVYFFGQPNNKRFKVFVQSKGTAPAGSKARIRIEFPSPPPKMDTRSVILVTVSTPTPTVTDTRKILTVEYGQTEGGGLIEWIDISLSGDPPVSVGANCAYMFDVLVNFDKQRVDDIDY